ncbi:MAG: hypothetical protein KAW93_04070 [Methanogenium sp.]|nr:hypothetical protein [Methanogenium sp.]
MFSCYSPSSEDPAGEDHIPERADSECCHPRISGETGSYLQIDLLIGAMKGSPSSDLATDLSAYMSAH